MYEIKGLTSGFQNNSHLLTIHMQDLETSRTFNLVTIFSVTTSKNDILTFLRMKLSCPIENIQISKHVNFATVGILT